MRAAACWKPIGLLALLFLLSSSPGAETRTRSAAVGEKPAAPAEPRNRVSIEYEYEHFNRNFSAWHWASLEYGHRFDRGTLLGRVNRARRFGDSASQYEADAYPKLGKGKYLYLNYGVAQKSFLPDRRYGAELFWSLPKAFEVSGGLRRLEFDVTHVNLYTGSLGWYRGNYYSVVRPWVSEKPGSTSVSGSFMIRRYFETRDDHLTVRVGGGQGSDFDQSIDQLLLSHHWYVLGEGQRKFGPVWVVRGKAGYRDQKFRTGTDRQSWLVGAGIARLF